MTRIVIAGGGLAAQRCAETLRALGHDGPLTMLAAEDRAPYDRPPLSKAVLAGERPQLALRPDGWHAEHGVELLTGTPATGLDPDRRRVRTPAGELAYDRLLIATGARPVTLPGLADAQTLRSLDDAVALAPRLRPGAHVAVLGAGLIGQEIASAAVARGARATLIDAAERPFDALMGPRHGDWLRRRHERAGVRLRLGRRLVATRGATLVLDDDGTVAADHVVVAVGVRPDTEWTALWPCGVPAAASHDGIYAAGDCVAGAAGHWEAAARQGAAAARAMLGLPARAEGPALVWSDQHGARIQKLGDPREADRAHADSGEDDFTLTFERAGRPVAFVLVNRPGAVAAARRRLLHAITTKEAA